jgi:recombination protein RecR
MSSILPKAVSRVIESFSRLPGIGPKTAQRLAFYLLHVPQEELDLFAKNLSGLKTNTILCSVCKNVAEADPCTICSDPIRDQSLICVVEQPPDMLSIERTGHYRGVYHVLHGAIDPLNNIGPDEIYIADLIKRLTVHGSPVPAGKAGITEIILAMNPNMEGEATAMYIQKQIVNLKSKIANGIKLTRLAHGLPIGADIEYADDVTLTRALEGRREF